MEHRIHANFVDVALYGTHGLKLQQLDDFYLLCLAVTMTKERQKSRQQDPFYEETSSGPCLSVFVVVTR